MPPTVSASPMVTPVEVDADIDFDFDFEGDDDLPPTRGRLSGACAEAVQELTRLQRLITPIIRRDDDAGIDPGWVPIDWQAGVAELLDVRGNVRTQLCVAPAEPATSPEAIDKVAQAFLRLLQGAAGPLSLRAVHDRQCTLWPIPSTVTLDGDVLRFDSFVIGRRLSEPDPEGSFWAMRPDVGEIQHLMFQRSVRDAAWIAANGVDRYPRPTFDHQAPASTRKPGRFDETWVFDVAGDADVATVLANSRAEPTRLFRLSRQPAPVLDEMALREIRRDENASPAAVGDGAATRATSDTPAPQRRVRAMVLGDSARHEGSAQPRAGDYDAPSLARALKAAFGKIADRDATAPVVPTHVSIISSHHESQAFRSDPDIGEPSFGTSFLKTAVELFDAPAMTASVRRDGFRVASQHPRHLEQRNGERTVQFGHNVVQMAVPDLDGRKFVRSSAGDYLNKAPGGTVKLWRADDGSIRSADKYPDLGQTHVRDSGQDAGPLIAWLQQRSSLSTRPPAGTAPGPEPLPGKSPAAPPPPALPLLLGEVDIQRSLLRRMGWRDDGRRLDVPGAFLRLRFSPGPLLALIDGGTAPERIAALRLLRQMLRAGLSMSMICQPDASSASKAQIPAALNLLLALKLALDDDLMLPVSLWEALWHGTPPPLPQRVPGKGMDLRSPRVR